MRILGIIPARAGSRRIPGKNMKPLCGKPLIQWTLDVALDTLGRTPGCDISVSTDCPEVAALADSQRIHVINRPPELASDTATTVDVVKHALTQQMGRYFDAVMVLQPTNPLRIAEDVDAAVGLLGGYDSVCSMVDVSKSHPELYDGNGRPAIHHTGKYRRDGSVYAWTTEALASGSFCHGFIEIPLSRHCNIDEPHDLAIAEALMRFNGIA